MSSADLVADLKVSLHDAAGIFTAAADADFTRLLAIAAQDLARVRPLIKSGTLTLVAGTASYSAPSGLVAFGRETWSAAMPQAWESTYCGPLPRISLTGVPAARKITFTPAPTEAQVAVLGATFDYLYLAAHVIGAAATDTTVQPEDRAMLLLRAQAEAVREMAFRNLNKPISLRDGSGGTTRNGTPSYLFESLMREFREAV
jgi:hypothetical protein